MSEASGEFSGRLAAIRERIATAAVAAGRDPATVTLVAVAKGQPVSAVRDALAAGLVDIGENRAQELEAKARALDAEAAPAAPVWHFVGRLQRNKVARLAARVACWHSIDTRQLVEVVGRHAPGARVYVEVNIGGEPGKGGCPPDRARALVEAARAGGLEVLGLMTVPPAREDARPHFAALRKLAEQAGVGGLSMGMSSDFEVAIAEGATVVRVGEALFGARSAPPSLQR